MRRKEIVAMLGCIVVSALFGGAVLLSPGVGVPVSLGEAGMKMGGNCYELGPVKKWICFSMNGEPGTVCSSGGCGCRQIQPLVSKTTGGSRKPAAQCASSQHCTAPQEVGTSQCGGE